MGAHEYEYDEFVTHKPTTPLWRALSSAYIKHLLAVTVYNLHRKDPATVPVRVTLSHNTKWAILVSAQVFHTHQVALWPSQVDKASVLLKDGM